MKTAQNRDVKIDRVNGSLRLCTAISRRWHLLSRP